MSIALATKGKIGGFMGGGGEPVYVDVPVCAVEPETEEFGELTLTVTDPNALPAIPNPIVGGEAMPRRRSEVEILPRNNTYI